MYKRDIIDEFAAKGLLSKDLENELVAQCRDISPFDAILSKGIPLDTTLKVMGEYYGLPVSHIDALEIDRKLLEKFSKINLEKNKFLPISLVGNVMTVALCDPTDFISLSSVKAVHHGKVKYILVDEAQLMSRIKRLAAATSAQNVISDLNDTVAEEHTETAEILNSPAVVLVDSLIKEAISLKASDIHIEPFEKTVRVRYRLDGALRDRAEFPVDSYPAVCARLKILSGINIAEKRIPQDGHFSITADNIEYDFRVSSLPTVNGEKFVVRILDKSSFGFTRKELGFTKDENEVVDKILAHPHGIVLLTGPTGCGKTTTLYSFLRELNKEEVNIVTVEDPVEYTLHGINQTQINPKANLTFANVLRSILRQDPNIVMIGEIRDEETAQIAIRAAITGHLVFSTLHTNDAPGSIVRLMDMGIESYLVADAIVAVIAQRLVKKLCPHCKRKVTTDAAQMAMLKLDSPAEIYEPCGCRYCNGTGYKGRTAVHEIMYVDDELRLAINNRAYHEDLQALAVKKGMTPLWDACRKLVLDGTTSLAELISIIGEE